MVCMLNTFPSIDFLDRKGEFSSHETEGKRRWGALHTWRNPVGVYTADLQNRAGERRGQRKKKTSLLSCEV